MRSVSGLTRATEWWRYKIPTLLGVSYALLLLTSPVREPLATLGVIAAVMTSIIAVAAFGCVINGFDIESNRRVGKKNSTTGLTVAQRVGLLPEILALGWLPAWLAGYSHWSCILLAIIFLLPIIQVIPTIRAKDRDVLGVLTRVSAAHLLPTLLIGSVLLGDLTSYGGSALVFLVVAATWYTLVGLRGLINRQLFDEEADLASGVANLPASSTRRQFLNRMQLVLYVLEVISFAAMIVIISQTVPIMLPVYVLFAVLEITKRFIGWPHSDRLRPGATQRAYLPFANNNVYAIWLPFFLVLAVAVQWPWLCWLVLVHLALFGPISVREYREPFNVLNDLYYTLRPIVGSWRYGWMVIGDRADWPEISWSRETLGAVRIRSKRPLANPWDLRIVGPQYPVAVGQSYQLRLRIRSEHARSVTVGLCQRHSPYQSVGLTEVVPVTMEWEDFFFDFTAPETEANAAIFIWLGGRDTAVEIAEAQLVNVAAPGPWKLTLTQAAEGSRAQSEDPSYLVKVDRIHTDGKPWQIKLTGSHYSIRKGETYRVQVSVRSRGNRPLTFGVAQSYSPFEIAGLCENIVIQDEFQEFQGDFIADQDEEVSIFFWLGGDTSAVEILNADISPVHVSRHWTLHRKEGCHAWRVATDDPERVVVELGQRPVPIAGSSDNQHMSQWDVTLKTPLEAVEKGHYYRVVLPIRAAQNRSVTIAVCQANEPSKHVGFSQQLSLNTTLRAFTFDFLAELSDSAPHFVVAVAEESSLVEIGLLEFEPISPQSVWCWNFHAGCSAIRLQGKSRGSILVQDIQTDADPWHVQLVGHPRVVRKGENYRWECRWSAKAARKISFGLRQSVEPFQVIGLWKEMTIGPEEQKVSHPFAIPFDDPSAVPFMLFGDSDQPVDISHYSLVTQEIHSEVAVDSVAKQMTQNSVHESKDVSVDDLTQEDDVETA